LPGLPLRTEVTVGEENIVSTVVSVKSDPLADAEFLPPKDFQEVKVPNVEVSADKPAPAPPAKP
jgi:hypothetical protein